MNNDGRSEPLGVPRPYELPPRRWGSIPMNFITYLPATTSGYDCITTFVGGFTKRVLLVFSKGTDTATEFADCFFDQIFCLHGLPDSITSNIDPKFTSIFWSHLMHRCDIKLKMSTSRHSQIDCLTDIMNRMVSNYLRCYYTFSSTWLGSTPDCCVILIKLLQGKTPTDDTFWSGSGLAA